MVQAFQHTNPAGAALIPLLASLTAADVPHSGPLADTLSQWLGWTHAIDLSNALSGNPSLADIGTRTPGNAAESEYARVRTSLASGITGDAALNPGKRATPRNGAASETPIDFPSLRHIYVSKQQAMETAIGQLRTRLREMLAARNPGMNRLAMLDATMERALNVRERGLLSGIPILLAAHFNHLREAEANATDVAGATSDKPASTQWLDTFRKDMQALLLAELDLRFQPVDGLLAALRAS
jgi:hypothetical protein